MSQKLTITTKQPKEIVNLTGIINDLMSKNMFLNGLCFLNCMHTTCALTVAEIDDEEASSDYLSAFEAMTPKLAYKHPHNPSHFGSHFLSAVTGTSLFIPIQSTSLVLGTHQKIILVEFDGPKERRINITLFKEQEKSNI